jgi:hypothetical protein
LVIGKEQADLAGSRNHPIMSWAAGRFLASLHPHLSLSTMPERRPMNLSAETIADLPVESVALVALQVLH